MLDTATRTERPDTAATIGQQLIAAEHRYTHALETALRQEWGEFPITVPQYLALQEISASPGTHGAELARALNLTPQTLSTVLQNLQKSGWIERASSLGEGRMMRVQITPSGKQALARADKAAWPVNAELLHAVDYGASSRPVWEHLDSILAAFSPDPQRLPKEDVSSLDEKMIALAAERHSQGVSMAQIRREMVYPTGPRAGRHPSAPTIRKALARTYQDQGRAE